MYQQGKYEMQMEFDIIFLLSVRSILPPPHRNVTKDLLQLTKM